MISHTLVGRTFAGLPSGAKISAKPSWSAMDMARQVRAPVEGSCAEVSRKIQKRPPASGEPIRKGGGRNPPPFLMGCPISTPKLDQFGLLSFGSLRGSSLSRVPDTFWRSISHAHNMELWGGVRSSPRGCPKLIYFVSCRGL